MKEKIDQLIDRLNPNIIKLIEDFNLEVVECIHMKGYEIEDNKLIVWHFDNDTTDKELCDFILQHPEIDTLYLGKAVTDNKDVNQMRKLHTLLYTSNNIAPVIQNIELEDDSRYCVVDGMLIDKETALVIDYASGRKNKSIHVPDGIVGLKEHCFNYNAYIENIEIPSTIRNIEGLDQIPYLKCISIYGKNDYFDAVNSVLYKQSDENKRRIFFIPPCHEIHKPATSIKLLLSTLFQSICKEAENGRWRNVSSDNFYYDEEYNKISIEYYGGFYAQEWLIEYQTFPTEIRIGYIFRDYWREFCTSEIFCKQKENDDIIRLDCKNCPNWDNCKTVYDSNTAYINKLYSMMRSVTDNDSIMIGGDYIYLSLEWNDCNAIYGIVLKFLDNALTLKENHPIAQTTLQPSLFSKIPQKEHEESANFPFSFMLFDSPLGYIKEKFESLTVDEEPPF